MVFEYAALRGTMDGMEPTVITEIADYYRKVIKYKIPPMTPLVGRDFNFTRAGIHADGLLKDEEIYNAFNTEKLLNRPVVVAVNEHSGIAGLTFWVNQYFNLKGDQALDKKDPRLQQLKEWVDQQYHEGRNTVIGDEELEEAMRTVTPGLWKELSEKKSE
jgi:isopropylmalate/homocitrate/citramalate synthase